jgi:N-acetylneuraminic acid mutarotase
LDALLKKILTIQWTKGPALPQGFQDSDGGIVRDTLITVGGFCGGKKGPPGKESKYPRGFFKMVWGLDLKNPKAGWQSLPDFPGAARQELFGIVVNQQLYVWGGFSYSRPFCYQDGYRLSFKNDKWMWDRMPDLPWPLATAGICAVGPQIYVMGGLDYDAELNDGTMFTNADRTGKIKRLGARLLTFDTKNIQAGWKELKSCPGTPRWAQAVATVNGKIYVIGGGNGNDNSTSSACTVVDNWRYNPQTDQWMRLTDSPIASGNFPSVQIVYKDRYILLIGGYQYKKIMNPDGTTREPYGKPFAHYPEKDYYSDVFVYDTRTETFGTASPLPLNNNLPMAVLEGNRLHLIGGETAGSVIEGEHFGHHPDLYLIGEIKTLK